MPHDDPEDWHAYRLLFKDNQKVFREQIDELFVRVGKLEIQVAKTAAIYGLGSGLVTVIITELVKHAIK